MVRASSIREAVPAQVTQTTTMSAQPDEQRLIAAAKAGDHDAYGRLLARHQAVAFRAAYLIIGSAAEAEEATQEACVKGVAGPRALPGRRAVSPVAGSDRDQRGAQPSPCRRPSGRACPPGGLSTAAGGGGTVGRDRGAGRRGAIAPSIRGRSTARGRSARDRSSVLPGAL